MKITRTTQTGCCYDLVFCIGIWSVAAFPMSLCFCGLPGHYCHCVVYVSAIYDCHFPWRYTENSVNPFGNSFPLLSDFCEAAVRVKSEVDCLSLTFGGRGNFLNSKLVCIRLLWGSVEDSYSYQSLQSSWWWSRRRLSEEAANEKISPSLPFIAPPIQFSQCSCNAW